MVGEVAVASLVVLEVVEVWLGVAMGEDLGLLLLRPIRVGMDSLLRILWVRMVLHRSFKNRSEKVVVLRWSYTRLRVVMLGRFCTPI